MFIYVCRLSVVVVLTSYQTVADVISSCAYSPEEVIHIGVRLIFLPNKVVFPFSLPAVGTLSQIDVVVCTLVYEKHAIAHALFLFISFCRLSVVVILISYQTVADVIS